MGIENKFKKYSSKKGNKKHRYVITGQYTIDLKEMKAWLTMDSANEAEHFDIERGATLHRDTRSDPAIKFATNIAAESLKEGNTRIHVSNNKLCILQLY